MKYPIANIDPHNLHRLMARGQAVHLVDVRTPAEYADGHAAGALSLPLEQVDARRIKATVDPEAGEKLPVYLICASGMRAEQAAAKLRAQGMQRLVLVDGGTEAWARRNLPLQRTSRLPSLERQTQIAVGAVILLLLAKASLLHPVFYALVGLMGAGLLAAGVTGRCGLAALLARMPWNRRDPGQTAASA
jgi:rhodanese-related sulfurtransferase